MEQPVRIRLVISLLALVACLPSVAVADDPWIEVKSPNFTVVSNAGEGRARNVAWQFELVTQDTSSPYYTNGTTRSRFDAQCWGVMHYMLFGLPDGPTRVNQLADLLLKGASSADAIQRVFGNVDALEQAYLKYQKQPITQYARLKVETNASSKSFPVRPLAPAESVGVHAAVHATFGRPVEARAAIASAGSARSAATYDVEALLLDREGKRDEAKGAYAKAVELNSESFYTYYRLATLTWTARADADTRSRMETLLRRSVALNSFYSPSVSFLADTIAQGSTPADALPHAVRGASLDPTSVSARLTLARVLGRLSRRDEAIGHARAARTLARNDEERAAADELIGFLTRLPTK